MQSGDEVTHKYLLGRMTVSWLVTTETPKRDILLFAYTGRAIKFFFFFGNFFWRNKGKGRDKNKFEKIKR